MVSMTNTIASTTPILAASVRGWRPDSWKEIAVYVRREVRTVQRWEKREGMPVHRDHPTDGNTVYAFREEIDAWLFAWRNAPESGEWQRCLFS